MQFVPLCDIWQQLPIIHAPVDQWNYCLAQSLWVQVEGPLTALA